MSQTSAISQRIWDAKYRFKTEAGDPVDKTIEDSWQRVAVALARPEKDRALWSGRFAEALADFQFIPAGRILAGAGTDRRVTLFNCFVMGTLDDSMDGIFQGLKEAALTMQQGGGIGYDFSTLRPKGAPVRGVGADASGPLSFMDVWDAMCRTIMSAGHRRGAMMATLRCDHPDIEAFVEAKQDAGRLRMFNLSVLVTDAFMTAVKEDAPWELAFAGTTYKTMAARELWDKVMRSTYACAEPGVIFIDRINRRNNLAYCETIYSTNPCGEQPLPPYGACLLGSINLPRLVDDPFGPEAQLDMAALERLVPVDVAGLAEGRQRYALFTNERGGILDDLMITNAGDHLFLVVNGACKEQDLAHLRDHLSDDCAIEPLHEHALLALQGPQAAAVLGRLAPGLANLVFMTAARAEIAGADCFVSRSGYTGEDGFEISVPAARAEALARRLLAEPEVAPVGLGARDSLRLEAGLCLYGHDMDAKTTPVEASLTWALSKARRRDGARPGGYLGAEAVMTQLENGATRRRIGIRPEGRAPPREGVELIDGDGRPIGRITSGGFGPTFGAPVAMGYVETAQAQPGTKFGAMLRGKVQPVEVVKLPFVPQRYYRG